jgi:Zn ribbon nucleic-acid-binding protein
MATKSGARCPECGSKELLTVTMSPQGERVSFSLCNACGWKRWGRADEGVLLSSIQVLFGKPRARQRPVRRTRRR